MTVGNILVGNTETEAISLSQYKRDPSWSVQEPYSMEDVTTGFHDAEQPLQKPPVGRLRVMALALAMGVFPFMIVLTVMALGAVMGWGVDGVRIGIAQENPAITSGALAMVGCAFLFLMRLLFRVMADWRRRYVTVALDQREYSVLYRFVGQVAEAVNGPVPTTIKIDNEVGLVLRKRTNRMGRKEVELLIGLPLFHSLSARQLSGLIAHAYGGFSRANGSLGYPFVANINRWLVRLSEGDASRLYDESSPRVLVALFQPVDWVLTQYLSALCRCAGYMSFSVSRGMDIQGDAYSARLGGATEFRATQIRLRALQLGKSRVFARLGHSADLEYKNIARLIAEEADQLQFELRAQLVREMEDLVSPLTRSRVVDLGRIVEVEKGQDEGACFLLGAAVRLLPHVDSLGQRLGARYLGAQETGI